MPRILGPTTSPAPPRRVSRSLAALAFGVLAAAVLWLSLEGRAASTRFRAGIVFAPDACDLSPGIARTFGGPLTRADCAEVERIARDEIAAAFRGLRLDLTGDDRAFWTVHVIPFVPARTRMVGASGASVAFGPLGGRGIVGLTALVGHVLRHSPPDASRAEIIAALGRGVGRTVVHELAHQIAGGAIDSHDSDTYEYFSADHRSRYYGDVRWGRAGARLRAVAGSR